MNSNVYTNKGCLNDVKEQEYKKRIQLIINNERKAMFLPINEHEIINQCSNKNILDKLCKLQNEKKYIL